MRRTTSACLVLVALFSAFISNSSAVAYMVETHRVINEAILDVSTMKTYFADELSVSLDSRTFHSKTALDLLRKGGDDEDSMGSWCYLTPYPRSYNHFHDPLKSWEQAGFAALLWYNGISSVLYAEYDRLTDPPDLCLLDPTQCPAVAPNLWTWDTACEYFREGLTAHDVVVRDMHVANLFLGLGHLTHLVADASVAEHTRNDAHIFRCYEDWCAEHLGDVSSSINGTQAFRNAFGPNEKMFAHSQDSAFGSLPLSPISNLWDSYPGRTDADQGYNGALWSSPRLAGLAEYSNANYFGGDTVFSSKYYYPNRSETVAYESEVTGIANPPDGEPYTDRVIYFRGWTTDNIEVPHLAAADLLYKEWSQLSPAQQGWVPAHLDDYCYQDYALNLVPRAVSHGTALVDYFFRAKFAVTAEGSQLTVTNQSAGRAQGTVQVYADDAAGNRTLVFPTGSAVMNIDLQPDASVTSANAFSPPETTDLRYTMVFDGTIENTGAITVQDHAVGGTVFTWTPQTLPPIVAVGDNPRGMALTPGGLKLYVANYSSGTVSVIDTTRGVVTATIPVGAGPVDVAVSPDGTSAYVSCETGKSVSVIDTAADMVVWTVTGLPAWPEDVAVTADSRYVYVAHWNNVYHLTRINVENSYAASFLTSPSRACQGITMHSEKPEAYLSYYSFFWRKAVGVLNLADDSLAAALPGPDLNWGVAVDTSGEYLYVASPRTNAVSAFTTADRTQRASVAVGSNPRGVAAGPDGRIYVANLGSDDVSVIDPGTNNVVATIAAGDGAYDAAVSPDGRYLFVSNAFADTVSIISLTGSSTIESPEIASPMLSVAADGVDEEPLATVVLADFPADGRVYVDGEFPRQEEYTDLGLMISFPPGDRTLLLACPGYQARTMAVSASLEEVPVLDGSLQPE